MGTRTALSYPWVRWFGVLRAFSSSRSRCVAFSLRCVLSGGSRRVGRDALAATHPARLRGCGAHVNHTFHRHPLPLSNPKTSTSIALISIAPAFERHALHRHLLPLLNPLRNGKHVRRCCKPGEDSATHHRALPQNRSTFTWDPMGLMRFSEPHDACCNLLLQQYCCNITAATVKLEQSTDATVLLQQYCCNVLLQQDC